MVELKKNETHLWQFPQKKISSLPLSIRFPPEFQKLFSPHLLTIFVKNQPPTHSKRRGKTQTTKHSVIPLAHTGICIIFTMYLCRTERHLLWLGIMLKIFQRLQQLDLLKIDFSAQQLFLNTLPQKLYTHCLCNYTNSEFKYTVSVTTEFHADALTE